MNRFDVLVIGGGQSGLAVGYYLRRTGLSFLILDREPECGGSWQHAWKSLQLFSPAQWSSLPGTLMSNNSAIGKDDYPPRDVAIDYLRGYERKYNLPVKRPVRVSAITKDGDDFVLETSDGTYRSAAIVSATGSFTNPYQPQFPGQSSFKGQILHSSKYVSPEAFAGMRVAVVGEGNSGAQILAEVSRVANTLWVTQKEPRFLPDHIDGRFLFDAATQMYEAQKSGKQYKPPSLGDIVMVPSVKDARDRNALNSMRPFDSFNERAIVWSDGRQEEVDAVIFCTGFKPALNHLRSLGVVNESGRVETIGTKAKNMEGLWLVGYGQWTGFASATLIGVGRSAKTTVDELDQYLAGKMENRKQNDRQAVAENE